MKYVPRDPAVHLAWFRTLPEDLRVAINAQRVKAGLPAHDVHGDCEDAPPVNTPPLSPPQDTTPGPVDAWNGLIAEYLAERARAASTLEVLGRGPEYEACVDTIESLKLRGKMLRSAVEAHLGRELTREERVKGVER